MRPIGIFGKIISKIKSEQEYMKNRKAEVKKIDNEDTKYKYENSKLKNIIDSITLDSNELRKNLEEKKNKNLELENYIKELIVN